MDCIPTALFYPVATQELSAILPHIQPFIHSHILTHRTAVAAMQGDQPARRQRSRVRCALLRGRLEEPGIEAATFRLPANPPLWLLSLTPAYVVRNQARNEA